MESRASLFSRAWACCAILDLTATVYLWLGRDPWSLSLGAAVLVAAAATALRPSTPRLAALAGLWAAHVLYHFPLVPNHNVAIAAMNLAIAATTLSLLARRRGPVPLAAAAQGFATVVRVQLIALYAIAALHKLNWDYLDPAVSCAPAMARAIAAKLGVPFPAILGAVSIWSSLALEIAIPLLLAFPRTRREGLALGLVFHLVLGLDSVVPILGFSAAVYCVYILFLPARTSDRIVDGAWLPPKGRARAALVLAVLAASAGLALLAHSRSHDPASAFLLPPPVPPLPAAVSLAGELALRLLWHAFALAALLAFARTLPSDTDRDARRDEAPLALGAAHPALLVFALLLVANGIAPYLGYKTVPCFSMFSNLNTGGGTTNHVFLTPRRHPQGEDDLVEIVASSSRGLRAAAERDVRIPFFELRRLLSGEAPEVSTFLLGGTEDVAAPGFWCDVRRNGRTIHVSRAGTPQHPLFRPHGWLASKLLAFRPMPRPDRPVACLW